MNPDLKSAVEEATERTEAEANRDLKNAVREVLERARAARAASPRPVTESPSVIYIDDDGADDLVERSYAQQPDPYRRTFRQDVALVLLGETSWVSTFSNVNSAREYLGYELSDAKPTHTETIELGMAAFVKQLVDHVDAICNAI